MKEWIYLWGMILAPAMIVLCIFGGSFKGVCLWILVGMLCTIKLDMWWWPR